ncbi:MAG: hypothetical protein FJW68_06795 [Actinobacteria bacterium]|nr:hypothetical protein [Actinomycetota bacterium]
MELRAYCAYRNPELEITYWRTSTGYEVDFILNDKQTALEIKSGRMVHDIDLKSLKALREDGPIKHSVIAFIKDYKVIKKILDWLSIDEFKSDRPPPKRLAVADLFDDYAQNDYIDCD